MAVESIQRVPRELPYARIYLDDIEAIQAMFVDFYKADRPDEPITFHYLVNDKIKVTTLAELSELGDRTSLFDLNLKGKSEVPETVLSFHEGLEPSFSCPYEIKNRSWEAYGKTNEMFLRRRDPWKTYATSVSPYWWLAVFFATYFLTAWFSKHPGDSVWIAGAVTLILTMLAYFLHLQIAHGRKNWVILNRSWTANKEKSVATKERNSKLLWLSVTSVITFVLGLVSGVILERLKHK